MTDALALVKSNAELAKLYNDSSKLGSQNLQGAIPMLKIHTTNKSVGNELLDGKEPHDGWFFLTGNQEEFQSPLVHILTVSRGFRAEGMVDKSTGKKGAEKFNQILGGVIVDGEEFKPFIMYFTGIRLSKLWEFGKEVSKYTHQKPVGIPMFALSVKLSTTKVKHEYGTSYAVDFEVQRDKDSNPILVTDEGKFIFLRDNLSSVEETIENLIAQKSTEEKAPTQGIKDVIISDEDMDKELDKIQKEAGQMPF